MKKLLVPSLVMVALLSACTGGAPAAPTQSNAPASQAGSPTATPTTATAEVIKQAKMKAAGHDYAGALALLKGNTSEEAKKAAHEIEVAEGSAVDYVTPEKTSHLFYHSLIVDPKRAFDPKKKDYAGWTQWMVTQSEFEKQLQQIYDNGYVLVHPERLFKLEGGTMVKAEPIKLPEGKKPLVFSVDDINYYSRQDDGGFARKLIIAKDGNVKNTYQDADGQWHEGAYDVPTVIDAFVKKHPDFSYQGDKGMISLTGYEGVLGYRSSPSVYGDTEKTKQEAAEATKVADAMKKQGWTFANHTWKHISMQPDATSLAKLKADLKLWDDEVKPIVGETNRFIFAFGSDVGPTGANYKPYDPAKNDKFAYLHDELGYRYFFPIDSSVPYWSQKGDTWWRQARIDVDGITMQRVIDGKKSVLDEFFDTNKTVDPLRPNPIPTINTGVA